jgi:hypothetical protein
VSGQLRDTVAPCCILITVLTGISFARLSSVCQYLQFCDVLCSAAENTCMLHTVSNNMGYPLHCGGGGGGCVGWAWRFGGAQQHQKLYVCKGVAICCY